MLIKALQITVTQRRLKQQHGRMLSKGERHNNIYKAVVACVIHCLINTEYILEENNVLSIPSMLWVRSTEVPAWPLLKASDYLSLASAERRIQQRCSISAIHLFHPPLFPLSSSFFSYSPHLPSGEMVWPFWSKQALITPWEGIVRGTAQGIWKGPHKGTWDLEIDAAGERGVTAPNGKCTAPADGVSLSTLGKCVKDSERRRRDLGEIDCSEPEQWADKKNMFPI